MKMFRTRPGVVLTTICDEHILIAARDARAFCPYSSQISESAAFLWKQLQNGADRESLFHAVNAEYQIEDPEAAQQAIDMFIAQMTELGYLLQEGE